MRKSQLRRRERLRGWIKWTPFLAAPFAILFAEVWMNIHMYHFAYEENRLREELRATTQHIHELREHMASMSAVDKMRDWATYLGLEEATYQQIQIVRETTAGNGTTGPMVEPDYHVAFAEDGEAPPAD